MLAVRRKVLYLLFAASVAALLLGAPSAPAHADCGTATPPICGG